MAWACTDRHCVFGMKLVSPQRFCAGGHNIIHYTYIIRNIYSADLWLTGAGCWGVHRETSAQKSSASPFCSVSSLNPQSCSGEKKKKLTHSSCKETFTTEAQTLTGQTWYFFRCTVIAIYLSLSRNNMVFSRSNNSKWIHCEQRKVCTLLLLLTSCLLNQQCHAV